MNYLTGYTPLPEHPWRPMVVRGFFWHAQWGPSKVSLSPEFRCAKWRALLAVVVYRLLGRVIF